MSINFTINKGTSDTHTITHKQKAHPYPKSHFCQLNHLKHFFVKDKISKGIGILKKERID
jgi:hypothetical protein